MDVVTERTASRLDRGHHRQHVQRQERGAHPPAAPGADREAEGPDLQAARSTTAYSEDHIVSHSDMRIRVAERAATRDELLENVGRRHRSGRDRRGAVLRCRTCRPSCNDAGGPGQARHRRGPGSGLSRPAVRADAAAARRSPNTSPRRSRSAWSAATRRTTRSGSSRSSDRVLVGATGHYEARCRHCFDPHLAGAETVARSTSCACVRSCCERSAILAPLAAARRRLPGRQRQARARDASVFGDGAAGALLTWPEPRSPRSYGMALAIGVVLGLLVFYKLVVSAPSGCSARR